MSKQQTTRKGNTTARPNPRATEPAARPTAGKAARPASAPAKGGARTTPNGARTGTSNRARQVAPQRGGLQFRSRDLVLLVVGVVLVAIIIVTGLNFGGNNTSPQGGTTGTGGQTSNAQQPAERSLTPLAEGIVAPDFSLPGADGNTYSLSQYKGKVVLLEFMAPWCPHCQEDAAMMNRLWDAYKDKNVQFLALSATPYGKDYSQTEQPPITMEDMTWFRDTFAVQFPMLLDKELVMADAYHIRYFPTLYVVNEEGNIAKLIMGEVDNPLTYERIAGEIDAVLQ